MSVTMNVSSSMIPLLMVTLAQYFGWRLSFALVGFSSSLFSCVAYLLVMDNPEDVPDAQKHADGQNHRFDTQNDADSTSQPPQKKLQGKYSSQVLLDLLSNKFLCSISFSYFLWTGVKQGVEDWLLIYLTRVRNYTGYEGSISIMCFQFGGIACLLTSGVISDIMVEKFSSKMRSSPRLPVVVFCSIFILPWIYVVQLQDITAPLLVNVACFFLGLCCYGPHTLYGLLVIENSPRGLSGTAHGISATLSTIGSVFSGYPLSYLITHYGWHAMFVLLASVAILNSVLLFFCMTFKCKIEAKKDE